MVNVRQPRDVAQILLSVLFLAIMIVACLWIVQPFILGFAWAGTVVIATWPVLLRLQKIMFGRRSLAVLVMTLLLVMVFIIPIALLVNSIVDGSGPLIKAISSGDMTLPDLAWLNTIPVIGAKLYAGWHNLLDMGDGDHGESPSLYWHHHHLVRWAGGAYRALYGALCADAFSSAPCCTGAVNRWHKAFAILQPVWQAFAEMPPCCWRHRLSARWRWVWW